MKKLLVLIMMVVCVLFVFAEGEADELSNPDELSLEPMYEELDLRISNVEEYLNVMYDSLSNKADNERVEALFDQINAKIDELYAAVNDVNQFVEAIDNLDVSTDILNDQILNIYEILGDHSNALSSISGIYLTKEDADVAIADIMNRIKSLEAAVNPEQMQSLQESVNAVEVQNDDILTRLSLLEEYTNLIYDMNNSKVSADDLEQAVSVLKDDIDQISAQLEKVSAKNLEQDKDIIVLYDAVSKLTDEVKKLSGKVSLLETVVMELRQNSGK
ncbi:MAG TPA: hypothetical protein PKW84_00660 [Fervidobacterium sp.]|mgnify:FL=1|nr:hypothetical protein [Fervidobacterium sp.]HQQ16928.1 hypothetical protein [Fervidobacterium sp.]